MAMMRALTIGLVLLFAVPALAETAGEKWERSLLEKKRAGTLPGPRPGQKCLWSQRLNACLWYTPGRWWGVP